MGDEVQTGLVHLLRSLRVLMEISQMLHREELDTKAEVLLALLW